MTSIPASRRARAMILAPRSWPSKPGFATTTRIFRLDMAARLPRADATVNRCAEQQQESAQDEQRTGVRSAVRERRAVRLGGLARGSCARGLTGASARVRCVAPAGLRPLDDDRAAHVRVRRADVRERARLVEGVRAALSGGEDARVERAVRRGG